MCYWVALRILRIGLLVKASVAGFLSLSFLFFGHVMTCATLGLGQPEGHHQMWLLARGPEL